jgi:predicted nuclease of predicted toxin-antitoxin system
VKVLLDECIDWRLARDITGHDVKTARQMGWTTITNGELLKLASEHFDVFITVDRNLAFQQNLVSLSIPVVVLQAKTNRLTDLRPLVPDLLAKIDSLQPGVVNLIGGT